MPNNPLSIKGMLRKKNSSFPSPVPLVLLQVDCAGRIARELWWTNQEIFPVNNIPAWVFMLVYDLGVEQ
jgi:hypothetical protein